jgi:hypothetical protein
MANRQDGAAARRRFLARKKHGAVEASDDKVRAIVQDLHDFRTYAEPF